MEKLHVLHGVMHLPPTERNDASERQLGTVFINKINARFRTREIRDGSFRDYAPPPRRILGGTMS